MTHSGGKPHQVGDRGQRFEVSFFDSYENRRVILGWTDDEDVARKMGNSVDLHPSWEFPQVRDRHADDYAVARMPQIHSRKKGMTVSEVQYKDIDGNDVSLDRLCQIEPGWAASRIRTMTAEIEKCHKEILALEEKRVELNVTIGERDEEIERLRAALRPNAKAPSAIYPGEPVSIEDCQQWAQDKNP